MNRIRFFSVIGLVFSSLLSIINIFVLLKNEPEVDGVSISFSNWIENSYLILLLSVFLVYGFAYKLSPGKAVNAADFFNLGMSGLIF